MDKELLQKWFYQMKLIRVFEERCAELYAYGKIGGFLHLYIGEEAIAVGALATVTDDDHLLTHYRDHVPWPAEPTLPLMAELVKSTGIVSAAVDAPTSGAELMGYAIVGGHLPLATGIGVRRALPGVSGGDCRLRRRRDEHRGVSLCH